MKLAAGPPAESTAILLGARARQSHRPVRAAGVAALLEVREPSFGSRYGAAMPAVLRFDLLWRGVNARRKIKGWGLKISLNLHLVWLSESVLTDLRQSSIPNDFHVLLHKHAVKRGPKVLLFLLANHGAELTFVDLLADMATHCFDTAKFWTIYLLQGCSLAGCACLPSVELARSRRVSSDDVGPSVCRDIKGCGIGVFFLTRSEVYS